MKLKKPSKWLIFNVICLLLLVLFIWLSLVAGPNSNGSSSGCVGLAVCDDSLPDALAYATFTLIAMVTGNVIIFIVKYFWGGNHKR